MPPRAWPALAPRYSGFKLSWRARTFSLPYTLRAWEGVGCGCASVCVRALVRANACVCVAVFVRKGRGKQLITPITLPKLYYRPICRESSVRHRGPVGLPVGRRGGAGGGRGEGSETSRSKTRTRCMTGHRRIKGSGGRKTLEGPG